MYTRFGRWLLPLWLSSVGWAPGALAGLTDIAQLPISTQAATASPNVIFGIDDSGSMDFEVLFVANDGALWWDAGNRRFFDSTGKVNFNDGGTGNSTWYKYTYLFPNGSAADSRRLTDSTYDHFAIPPTPQYAFARSAAYNPLYYNPSTTYVPWAPAYINNATRTFAAASTTATRSHPWFPTSGTPTTMVLTALQDSSSPFWKSQNTTFRMRPGMVIPFASIPNTTAKKTSASWTAASWTNNPAGSGAVADYTIPTSGSNATDWDVAIPYYPATYWHPDASCTSGADCAVGPDGGRLRRYEIKSGRSFPSGRSYAAELQNFANWFTYYRKRKLLLAAAAGTVFSQVQGIRGGTVYFNASSTLKMYDFSSTNDAANAKAVLGNIYVNASSGGTPTRDTLAEIGEAVRTNPSVVQYACQRNNAFIITDGFADASFSGSVPAYAANTWVGTRPFTTIYSKTLADIAASYYTINVRPDLPTGMLTVDPADTSPLADKNPNLHMNTYALTLGAGGTIYGTGSPAALNPFLNYPTWPNPNVNRNRTAVDDLWHATINGRGQMFATNDANGLVRTLRQAVAAMLARSGSDAAVAISNVNVREGDNTVYVSSYSGTFWTGQLAAYRVDPVTGAVDTSQEAQLWEARDQLTAKTPEQRRIATYNGSVGIPFQYASLPSTYKTALATPGAPTDDSAQVLAFLRGDRSLEGTAYRNRGYLLGDIVSAQAAVVAGASATYIDPGYAAFADGVANRTRMVYQPANDGMVHAFNGHTGAEQWAYVPSLVKHKLNALTAFDYYHRFYVDGTPTAGDVQVDGIWKTLLVGGLRGGGTGYYALDVTTAGAASEADAASKVLWEFPNAATASSTVANLGYSFGRPVLAKTRAAGWVVLVTSGYNNGGDGRGHLLVLNPATGAVIKDLVTTAGSVASPSGLAQIAAYAANPHTDATIEVAYGGDLFGNVWRFDLSGATVASWSVSRLATLVDSNGTPQPVTTTPDLTVVQGKRLVVVGTGKLLGQSDIPDQQVQSLYALVDDNSGVPIGIVRTALYRKTVTVGVGGLRNIGAEAVDFDQYRGWYFDLPGPGERVNTDPAILFGAVVLATNQPSPVACLASSFLYAVDVTHGGQLPNLGFLAGETPWSGRQIADVLANQPVLAMLASGKVEALTHASDGSLVATRVPLSATGRTKRIAWKEVLR